MKRKYPPGEEPEERTDLSAAEEHSGSEGELFTPHAYKESLQGLKWVEELNTLGRNWVMNTPGMEIQFKIQCGYASSLALAGVHVLCADDLMRSPDEDEWIEIITNLLMNDIEKYDPQKSTLGQRIYRQIQRRRADAIRIQNKEKNREEFRANILLLEDQLREDPTLRADPDRYGKWVNGVFRELRLYHYRRFASVLKNHDRQEAARAELRERLKTLEPGPGSLMAFCRGWADEVLKGEYVAPKHISVHTPVGDEEESELGEILPGSAPDPVQVVESNEAVLFLLQIITANFLTLKARGIQEIEKKNSGPRKPAEQTILDIRRKVLHYQLMITEQISYYGSYGPLPRAYGHDILAVFSEPYYRHFAANIEPDQALSLGVIEMTRLKQTREVIPDDSDTGPLVWKEYGFLEYKVMRSYLEAQRLRPSLSTIKSHRAKYIEALQQMYHRKAEG